VSYRPRPAYIPSRFPIGQAELARQVSYRPRPAYIPSRFPIGQAELARQVSYRPRPAYIPSRFPIGQAELARQTCSLVIPLVIYPISLLETYQVGRVSRHLLRLSIIQRTAALCRSRTADHSAAIAVSQSFVMRYPNEKAAERGELLSGTYTSSN
jgi:hypothetical protein